MLSTHTAFFWGEPVVDGYVYIPALTIPISLQGAFDLWLMVWPKMSQTCPGVSALPRGSLGRISWKVLTAGQKGKLSRHPACFKVIRSE